MSTLEEIFFAGDQRSPFVSLTFGSPASASREAAKARRLRKQAA